LNPWIEKERAVRILTNVNKAAFHNPVNNDQLKRVVDSIYEYKINGTLVPIEFKKKRKIVFTQGSPLDKDEKLEICREEYAKKRTGESKEKLYDILEGWDFDALGKISIRKVADNNPISKKTVAKYWSEFKEYVKELNLNYKNN
jgi:hypothetical protein